MLTAGYEFYRGTYHGDKITAAEWPVLSRDAAACLEELTLGRTAADLAPELLATGNVGQWLGFTFVEANGATGSIKYYDHTGAQKTVDMSKVQYVMYYHETLSVVSNFEVARIIDSERFAGSLAQVEMNTGYRVTNSKLARVRKVAGAG